ncbi:MAG: ABC transporter ATP-binding protein [Myxococcota bacterium]
MIEVVELTKRFGASVAVDRVTFEVAPGELVMLVGSSGSGKTTTLRMVNRLIEPSEGRLRLFGEDARALPDYELRRRIGYVFQRVGLFPHMTVAENVAITPKLLGWAPGRVAERVDLLLDMVELPAAEYRDRLPAALSGGQQQRVGVARALAAEPQLMLLDEPFGALDPATREVLQDRFQTIRSELGVGGIFVTHDMAEALLLGDRVGVMRAGRLVQLDTPAALLERPADDEVRALVDTPRRHAARLERVFADAPA